VPTARAGRLAAFGYAEAYMRLVGTALKLACMPCLAFIVSAATPVLCSQGARQYYPCQLSFDLQPNELSSPQAAMEDDLLHIEFRSPSHTTYLMRHFWAGGKTVRIRFTPTEPGEWAYKITSSVKRLDEQEARFTVAETSEAGMVNVANLRHWRSTNKKPHLWLGAQAPWLDLDQATFESWLDARKKNGFTHIRGILLTARGTAKPFSADGMPNVSYFDAIDDRVLAAENRGFTVDLIIADASFVNSGVFEAREKLDAYIRYIVGRYAGLNITWQGIERFEEIAGSRGLLRDIGLKLKKYDGFRHPRSTDARDTSSPLLSDGWMNFIMEASPRGDLGAVEHQFTEQPSIHVISTPDPVGFRHELWNATTNGQYPSVPFEALKNETNVKAVETWFKLVSDSRHWEFEPFFDVDGARAVAVDGRTDPYAEIDFVECLTYAQKGGIIEVTLPRHKYNPEWVNPATGEETPLKDTRTEVFSRETPDKTNDWILYLPREGRKESMGRSYYFESHNPPVQEAETDATKTPFTIVDPAGEQISVRAPAPFGIKITKPNRATRSIQYVWWGEVVAGGEGARVLGIGPSGTLTIPKALAQPGQILNLRLNAINANGKAYELDRVYTLTP
jgi:Protein of unknown function (DUF4038)/Domain of unknown function (DUF5060)